MFSVSDSIFAEEYYYNLKSLRLTVKRRKWSGVVHYAGKFERGSPSKIPGFPPVYTYRPNYTVYVIFL